MIVFRLFFTALILLWGPETSIAEPLVSGGSATVIEVIDGDTVILDGEIEGSNEVRLVGIQAPKLPLGRKGFKKWPLADESKKKLEKLTLGQTLDLIPTHIVIKSDYPVRTFMQNRKQRRRLVKPDTELHIICIFRGHR